MSIVPEDDYETWKLVVEECLQSGSGYDIVFPDFCRLLKDCAEKGSLQGDIAEYTKSFLEKDASQLLDKWLSFGPISEAELVKLEKQIIEFGNILAIGVINDKPQFISLLTNLLSSHPLYTKNYRITYRGSIPYNVSFHSYVLENFAQSTAFKIIDQRFQSGELPSPQLLDFGFTMLRETFPSHLFYNVRIIFEKSVAHQLSQQLQLINSSNLRDFDPQKLSQTISVFHPNYSDLSELYPNLLNFILLSLKSEYVNHQIVAVKLLTFIPSTCSYSKTFHDWIDKNKILELLLISNFHEQVLTECHSFIKIHAKFCSISLELFKNAWNHSLKVNIGQKEPLHTILANLLHHCNKSIAFNFINWLKSGPFQQDSLNFLQSLISIQYSDNPEIPTLIIKYLVELASSCEENSNEYNLVQLALMKLNSSRLQKESKIVIFNYIQSIISELYSDKVQTINPENPIEKSAEDSKENNSEDSNENNSKN